MKKILPLLFLIIISLLLRFYKLGEIPPGVTNDEIGYIYNAYSIVRTGNNIYGEQFPLITRMAVAFLPVPTYLIAPIVGLFGLTPVTGRFLNVIAGTGEVLLVYWLALLLFKSRKLAFFSALGLVVSPWHLQFSRSAYDAMISVFFYLLATTIVIFSYHHGKKYYIVALACLLLAVFSYRAQNILFLPLAIILFWYIFPKLKKDKKQLLIYIGGIVGIMAIFLLVVKSQGSWYTAETFSSDSPLNMSVAQKETDLELKGSKSSLAISRIFSNKLMFGIRKFRENYLGFFSTQYLFTSGEAQSIYSLWWRGMLYTTDLFFIIFGIWHLFMRNKRSAVLIVSLLLIGPLPAAFSGPTYSARSLFALPFLMILFGAGVTFITEWLVKRKKSMFYGGISVIILVYVAQFVFYLHQYYNRYSIYAAEAWFYSNRELSNVIAINQSRFTSIRVGESQLTDLLQFAFWKQVNPAIVQKAIKEKKKGVFQLENIIFDERCIDGGLGDPLDSINPETLYIARESCHKKAIPSITINELGSIRVLWKIYAQKGKL